jgi:hypothetical protein
MQLTMLLIVAYPVTALMATRRQTLHSSPGRARQISIAIDPHQLWEELKWFMCRE